MSIHLDWEIEAEQKSVRQQAGEDPESRRRRRRLKILLIPFVLLLIAGLIVGAVIYRLHEVEQQTERVLVDTVDAEVATLRLGDENAFLGFQRSASEAWLINQQEAFDTYQTRKIDGTIQLTGQVLDAVIDGSRARVQVQEIIDQAPYVRTWFYWRYEDGWRHVPPDYTFWGEPHTLEGDNVTVHYRDVDAPLAQSIHDTVSGWLSAGCDMLNCGSAPSVEIEIIPEPGMKMHWSAENPWLLRVASPYTGLARVDLPFDFSLRFDAANVIAERLVTVASGNMQPAYPADVFYLRSSIVSWLVGRFVAVDTNTFLLSSLAARNGDQAIGQLLAVMQPDSNAQIINTVAGTVSLDQAGLDWRDFLTWRLALENELITRGDEANFLLLYDTRNEAIRNIAYARYASGDSGTQRTVVSAMPETAPDGTFQLRAIVEVNAEREEILFRLVNGQWLRAN